MKGQSLRIILLSAVLCLGTVTSLCQETLTKPSKPEKQTETTKGSGTTKKQQGTTTQKQQQQSSSNGTTSKPTQPKERQPLPNEETSAPQLPTISSRDLSTPSGTINGHGYVDLGLSVKWAICNVGASSPTDYGNYYAWGETRTKSTYTAGNCTTWKKNIKDIIGNSNYDAATANWSSQWRMPTEKEIKELIDNCNFKWGTCNGINGVLVTSKKNGKSIFLPAAGSHDGSSLSRDRERCYYWSSSSYNNDGAYGLSLYGSAFNCSYGNRYEGKSVRPVSDGSTTGYINGHEYVDLGLSVKWATCNVGASSPEDYGNYYAWGETRTKSTYTDKNCTTWEKSMGDIAGNANYDAARANWGGTWRLPTKDEIQELIDNCTTEWATRNGVRGRLVKSKKNGKSIFLPAAGYRFGSSLYFAGKWGYDWSSSPNEGKAKNAYVLYFDSGSLSGYWFNRSNGQSVRPVSE